MRSGRLPFEQLAGLSDRERDEVYLATLLGAVLFMLVTTVVAFTSRRVGVAGRSVLVILGSSLALWPLFGGRHDSYVLLAPELVGLAYMGVVFALTRIPQLREPWVPRDA